MLKIYKYIYKYSAVSFFFSQSIDDIDLLYLFKIYAVFYCMDVP